MSIRSRLIMCRCLVALASVASGCISLPGRKTADSQPETVSVLEAPATVSDTAASIAETPEVVPVVYEDTAAETSPLEAALPYVVQRPKFPKQGWWCSEYEGWLAEERVDCGYTLVFPGIEGTSWFNISIARGLIDAGHNEAIEINDWTTGYRLMSFYHLMSLERNREQARQIATKICEYQDRYPGRPVRLIGHSGGAAIAVLVLEALPPERTVTQAVLLAGALSPQYDLSLALSRTEHGITNFYSAGDAFYLIAGTLALGTIDRRHSVASGAVGFHVPEKLSAEGEKLYAEKLHQVPYQFEMARSFNLGGHFGPVNRRFVAQWVAPRLAASGQRATSQD